MSKKSAKEQYKDIKAKENKKAKKEKIQKQKRKIKKTTIQTLPYIKYVNNTTLLLNENVFIGKKRANIYSKTYLVSDANYSSLTENEQMGKLQLYIQLLNGFDSTVSVQLSIINKKVDIEDFKKRILLPDKNDGYDELRHEFNQIKLDKMSESQNGLKAYRYLTVSVIASDLDSANNRFFTLESHIVKIMKELGSDCYLLDANDRTKLLGGILRPDIQFNGYTLNEFDRQAEKMDIAPDYFEFQRDFFMYDNKFCRCIYFRKLSTSILDTIYKDLIGLNKEIIITENLDFVDKKDAIEMLERKITDMNQETITKTRRATENGRGVFVDTITGSKLEDDKEKAIEFRDDIKQRGQNMIRGQFIIMVIADSFEQLNSDTDAVNQELKRYQIETISAQERQEVAFYSVLPIGNSCSADKENNLQVRRTLSSEAVAGFMPFNCVDLEQENAIYYGINSNSKNPIIFDRNTLNNPNGFIFGIPGTGKSVTAKLESIYSFLAFDDDIIIIDPDGEYSDTVRLLGGEVIYISQSSGTHINPLDLTENPDKDDKEYDPITSKLDLLLSFFSTIISDDDVMVTPLQRTIIDTVMRSTYKKYTEPTLHEYYAELEEYEKNCSGVEQKDATYLKQALHLYVKGSYDLFSHKTNVNVNARLICYNIKSLVTSLKPLGLMMVMENVWAKLALNRTKKIRTRIYIDEMYLLFKNESSSNFFYQLYKRARKWGGIPTGITQNVEDVLRSANARAMINTTEFVIMLSQNINDREELAKLLTIPSDTMRYVTNADKGTGLMHIAKYGDIPFDYVIPTDTQIYKTITTKFKEDI